MLYNIRSKYIIQADYAYKYIIFTWIAIQVHFARGMHNHWVTSSYIAGKIVLYDSLPPTDEMCPNLQKQLAEIYGKTPCTIDTDILTVLHASVQRQAGSNDCGLFAIAFALHAALGDNLNEAVFDQSQLRPHLVDCLTKGKLTSFPQGSFRSDRSCVTQVTTIPLLCHCKMPKSMDLIVKCNNCQQSFHYECVSFEPSMSTANDWYCEDCKSLLSNED